MIELTKIIYVALLLTVSGIILGATVITLGTFGASIPTKCGNSSFTYSAAVDKCQWWNSTATGQTSLQYDNFSTQYYSVYTSVKGQQTISEQTPTIAIIAVMVIIIAILASVFVYFKFFA